MAYGRRHRPSLSACMQQIFGPPASPAALAMLYSSELSSKSLIRQESRAHDLTILTIWDYEAGWSGKEVEHSSVVVCHWESITIHETLCVHAHARMAGTAILLGRLHGCCCTEPYWDDDDVCLPHVQWSVQILKIKDPALFLLSSFLVSCHVHRLRGK
jgi:hypothetical protein